MGANFSFASFARLLCSKHLRRDAGLLISSIRHVFRNSNAEIWNIDHSLYVFGMANPPFVQAIVEALMDLISAYRPDVIVDFANVLACIAARACHKPLIAVMQADQHPQSRGFLLWRQPPPGLPRCPVQGVNAILADHQAAPVPSIGELCSGDLTLARASGNRPPSS